MIEELEVLIGPDGKVSIHVRGVKGPACVELTRELEARLGGQVLERNFTDEYYQASAAQPAGTRDTDKARRR